MPPESPRLGLLAAFPLPPPAQEMRQQSAERKRGALPGGVEATAPPPILRPGAPSSCGEPLQLLNPHSLRGDEARGEMGTSLPSSVQMQEPSKMSDPTHGDLEGRDSCHIQAFIAEM